VRQGSHLPPSAVARIRHATESGVRFSQLGVASDLAVESCGLQPIGAVLGCTARRLDWGEFGLGEVGCGYIPSRMLRRRNFQTTGSYRPSALDQSQAAYLSAPLGLQVPPVSTVDRLVSSSLVVYADAALAAWRSAIDHMLAEAEGLGADGVVGVTLSEKHGKGEVREFVVSGTAVRSRGPTHLASAFTTTLSGGDVAKLMRAGWMPASIVLGLSVAIRHDTLRARLARARPTSGREVVGISELVHAARENARRQLASRTAAMGLMALC
jgi:uncharacterized protein YbjQ (UPF0145 family)